MKVVEIREAYGLDSLKLVQRPEPPPAPGQVLLKMQAFSINYRDLLVVNGAGRWKPPLGRIPLSDGVGIVMALGHGVTRFAIGDRVAPIFYPHWLEGPPADEKMRGALGGAAADGVLAEFAVFHESSLVHVPARLTHEEAATLPCAGLTAWAALASFRDLAPGDSLVLLGTGGVSLFALQFARLRGARVIVTSCSDEKLARATQLGAAAAINYKAVPDWPGAVLQFTNGLGADFVLDTAGQLNNAIAALRRGGSLAFVGLLAGMTSSVDLVALMGKSARIEAIDVGSREMFQAMNRAIEFHTLRPVVDRLFAFDQLGQALAWLREARHFGKICLRA
jgi:NADPH:quinone reductase-like Zn-dependent oxidoreductase